VIFLQENKNSITYDKNWQQVSEPQICVSAVSEEDEEPKDSPGMIKPAGKPLLLTVQLILCIVLGLAAFVLKSVGGTVFEDAKRLYRTQLTQSAVYDGKRNYDLNSLFHMASADER
jgi:hypothetical protein